MSSRPLPVSSPAVQTPLTFARPRIRLAARFSLSAIGLFATAMLVMFCVTAWYLHHYIAKQVQDNAALMAWRYAEVVGRELHSAQNAARLAAATIQRISVVNEGRPDRAFALNLLRSVLVANPQLSGARLVYEPGWLEDDNNFRNQSGHDESGRLMPYWVRNSEGENTLTLRLLEGLEEPTLGGWYQNTLHRKAPTITGPLVYPLEEGGRELIILSVPIVNPQGAAVGAIGVDVAIDGFLARLSLLLGIQFESAYLSLYNGDGHLIAGLVKGESNREWEISEDYASMSESMSNGKPGLFLRHITELNGKVWTFSAPVEVSDTGRYWTVAYNYKADYPRTQALLYWPGIAGIFLLALFSLLYAWYLHRALQPLGQLNQYLEAIVNGQVFLPALPYQGQDEIADSIRATLHIQHNMRETIAQANAIAQGDYERTLQLPTNNLLSEALTNMTHTLRELTTLSAHIDWIKSGETQLNAAINKEEELQPLCHKIIYFLSDYLGASIGMIYLFDAKANQINLMASYAFKHRAHIQADFALGEGVPGQAALEGKPIIIHQLPDHYLTVHSGLGKQTPQCLMLYPFEAENQLKGIIELAFVEPVTPRQEELMSLLAPTIGIAINAVQSRAKMAELLRQAAIV